MTRPDRPSTRSSLGHPSFQFRPNNHCGSIFWANVMDAHYTKRMLDEFITQNIPQCIWAQPTDFPEHVEQKGDLIIYDDWLDVGASIVMLLVGLGENDDENFQDEFRTYIVPTTISNLGATGEERAEIYMEDERPGLVNTQTLITWLSLFALDEKDKFEEYGNNSFEWQSCFDYILTRHLDGEIIVLNRGFTGVVPRSSRRNHILYPSQPYLGSPPGIGSSGLGNKKRLPAIMDSPDPWYQPNEVGPVDERIFSPWRDLHDRALSTLKRYDPIHFVETEHKTKDGSERKNKEKGEEEMVLARGNITPFSEILAEAEQEARTAAKRTKQERDRQCMPPPPRPIPSKVKRFSEYAQLHGWKPPNPGSSEDPNSASAVLERVNRLEFSSPPEETSSVDVEPDITSSINVAAEEERLLNEAFGITPAQPIPDCHHLDEEAELARLEDADEAEFLLNAAFESNDNAASGWMLEAYGSSSVGAILPTKPNSITSATRGLKGSSHPFLALQNPR